MRRKVGRREEWSVLEGRGGKVSSCVDRRTILKLKFKSDLQFFTKGFLTYLPPRLVTGNTTGDGRSWGNPELLIKEDSVQQGTRRDKGT